jgi:hypothetical protein
LFEHAFDALPAMAPSRPSQPKFESLRKVIAVSVGFFEAPVPEARAILLHLRAFGGGHPDL